MLKKIHAETASSNLGGSASMDERRKIESDAKAPEDAGYYEKRKVRLSFWTPRSLG